MHAQKLKLKETAADLGRRFHIKVMTTYSRLAEKRWEHDWQRQLMRATAAVTFIGVTISSAHADGLADMVSHSADQGDSVKTNLGRLFSAVGFGGAGYGGWNWWRKGKEGEQSQIKAFQIVGPLLGGMALGATGYFLVKAGETIGVSGSSQGQLPN